MNKWKAIWEKRKLEEGKITLEALIKADGFDSGSGVFNVHTWTEFVHRISELTGLEKQDTIFEVGCGSGAFLYPLYLNAHIVGGVDYTSSLVNIASEAMPGMDFKSLEANQIDPSVKYEVIVSNSVFQYFNNLNYAYTVIDKMIEKARKKIVILDINDKSKEEEAYRIRKAALSQEEYEKKYKDLNQLFYEKEWFKQIAKEKNCSIEIFDQDIKGYLNSSYRFNVIVSKNK